jgi:DNA helicase HerA-like ATPase
MADFQLGSLLDTKTGKPGTDAFVVQSGDLTTHGVIVGMTGSGKTGLGIVLLEEALTSGIPALILDPKGDMGNLLLTFPDLAPQDFRPWVNEDDARARASRRMTTPPRSRPSGRRGSSRRDSARSGSPRCVRRPSSPSTRRAPRPVSR